MTIVMRPRVMANMRSKTGARRVTGRHPPWCSARLVASLWLVVLRKPIGAFELRSRDVRRDMKQYLQPSSIRVGRSPESTLVTAKIYKNVPSAIEGVLAIKSSRSSQTG